MSRRLSTADGWDLDRDPTLARFLAEATSMSIYYTIGGDGMSPWSFSSFPFLGMEFV